MSEGFEITTAVFLDFMARKVPLHINEFKDIDFEHTAMFGIPYSGKTTTALNIGYWIEKFLDEIGYPFLCIHAMNLEDVFEYFMKNRILRDLYIYIVIDDAEVFMPSSRTKETLRLMGMHNTIRHRFRELGLKRGMIHILYSTQRYKNLSILGRNAKDILFKRINFNDRDETEYVADMIGWEGINLLKKFSKNIDYHVVTEQYHPLGFTLIKYQLADRPYWIWFDDNTPSQVVDLWSIAMQKELKKLNISTANLQSVKSFIEELIAKKALPIYRTRNGVEYYYITKTWLQKHQLGDVKLKELADLMDAETKLITLFGRPMRAVLIPVSKPVLQIVSK